MPDMVVGFFLVGTLAVAFGLGLMFLPAALIWTGLVLMFLAYWMRQA